MRPFGFHRAVSVADATALGARDGARFLAGGTELVAWLELGIARPDVVIDISSLPLTGVRRSALGIEIGALSRLADLGSDPILRGEVPALVDAIGLAASPAIRSMGTLGGNLLQRTRCPYFRSTGPCNQRLPGSGCPARSGDHRTAALFGLSDRCVAAHPSDLAVVLAVLDAIVTIDGPGGTRQVAIGELYPADSGSAPDLRVEPGDLLTTITIPGAALGNPVRYRKARDRAGFDFALVAAAGACRIENGTIVAASLALGSVGPGPHRCRITERALIGQPFAPAVIEGAIAAELAEATPLPGTVFKRELAARLAFDVLTGSAGGQS